jgi:hypothetical protein
MKNIQKKFDNRVLRRISGPKTEGENFITRRFITFNLHQILFQLSNEGG